MSVCLDVPGVPFPVEAGHSVSWTNRRDQVVSGVFVREMRRRTGSPRKAVVEFRGGLVQVECGRLLPSNDGRTVLLRDGVRLDDPLKDERRAAARERRAA